MTASRGPNAGSTLSDVLQVPLQRGTDHLSQLDDTRSPPGGDIVGKFDDVAPFDCTERVPPGALRQGGGVLLAALGVGQVDQVRIGVDHRFGR